uniref:Uncharacterized protein n=1 Tax=Micrurus spixii TaxID=129469 RepID=A0A2D4NHN2_9SAUR
MENIFRQCWLSWPINREEHRTLRVGHNWTRKHLPFSCLIICISTLSVLKVYFKCTAVSYNPHFYVLSNVSTISLYFNISASDQVCFSSLSVDLPRYSTSHLSFLLQPHLDNVYH